MPDLPRPPVATGPWSPASLFAAVRGSERRILAGLGAAVAVVVVGAVAWAAFGPGAHGGPPVELRLPRADAGNSPGAGDSPSSARGAGGGAERAAASTLGQVYVHVAGAVLRPGLYRLTGDARVADALDAAGGPAPEADLDAVNLAAKVADGERTYLPRLGDDPPAPASASGGSPGVSPGPIDLNTATAEQLDALPGVGPATAEAIVSYRSENGRFRSVEDLLEVRGIGEAKLAAIRPKVTVR